MGGKRGGAKELLVYPDCPLGKVLQDNQDRRSSIKRCQLQCLLGHSSRKIDYYMYMYMYYNLKSCKEGEIHRH